MRLTRLIIVLFLVAANLLITGCEKKEQIADPKALYDFYYANDEDRVKKVQDCRLLSLKDQVSNQECSIAEKAGGDKELAKRGSFKLGVVKKNMNEGLK
jgi:hypothetical protein